MQAPRLPSFFKNPKIKRFNFHSRYYDARKEKIEDLKKGKKIKFNSNRKYGENTKRNKRLLLVTIILTAITYLILKQQNWI